MREVEEEYTYMEINGSRYSFCKRNFRLSKTGEGGAALYYRVPPKDKWIRKGERVAIAQRQ